MSVYAEALRRHAAWEPHLRAFTALTPEAPCPPGPLAGLTVGVKDIVDVAGLPTRNGSASCADALPARADAEVVQTLRAAGACIFGKTITTEFAFTDATDCRNPHDLRRSPGGSSSGSGAAVAAGVVDVALGTQTAGSLCRPAAYCGAVGLKPSAGVLPRAGVTPLAPSFDTVGIIGCSVEVVRRTFSVLAQGDGAMPATLLSGLWDLGGAPVPALAAAFEEAAAVLGFRPDGRPLKAPVAEIVVAHRRVMVAEAFAAHGDRLDQVDRLRPNFAAALRAGATIAPDRLAEARALLARETDAFWDRLEADAVLTLPVPDGAPLLDGTTGFQDWLTPWTVFGGPLVSLPWGTDELGRPRAVMLAGRPGGDAGLLALAAQLTADSPPLPAPVIP